jgi:hypothetical protein
MSHPGIETTTKLVAQKDCRIWAWACQFYQYSEVSHHTVTPLGDFTLPVACFLHIHIDLVGPLPSACYIYCIIAVDHFPHSPDLVLILDITVDMVAHALLAGWISRFGCPWTITTDQGCQFEPTFPFYVQAVWHSACTDNHPTPRR